MHEYADHAKSGYKDTSARTAFQAMMAAAENGGFDTVISWKVDRFGRNREESALFKGRLRRFGVKVLYAMEPIPEGSAGVLLEGLLEATAEWYSRQLSENVTRGMHDNAKRCLYNGTRILGYTRGSDGKYQLVPDEADLVRMIFDRYNSGFSAARICRELNAHGLTTSRGKPFAPEGLLRIISNERYTGVYIWGDIRVADGMPPIIDRSTWEDAQRMKMKTARHIEQGAIDYLLTGKAFCGPCGASMIGDSGTSKDGRRHYYYTCQARKARKGCDKKAVQKEYLESAVISFILDNVLSDEQIERTVDAVMELQAEELRHSPLAAMEAERKEVLTQIDNINNAIAAGIWSTSTVTKLRELEASAETLRISCDTLRFSQSQLIDRDRVLFFLRQFSKGDRNDPLLRRHIIETFVNSVYVFDDHLKLVINNLDGNARVPLEALPECSDSFVSGVPIVIHPNTQVSVFRIAI